MGSGIKFYGRKPGSAYGNKFILRVEDSSGKKTDFLVDNSTGRAIDAGNGATKPVNPNDHGPFGSFLYKAQGQGQVGGGAANFLLDTSTNDYRRAAVYDESGKTLIEDLNSFQGTPEGGGGGAGGAFAPGQAGQFGFFPAYLGKKFPKPTKAKYTDIQTAPYKFTDPQEFAAKYGDFNRGEIRKNYDLANELALKELDTELTGLKQFVPAASALKRNEISLDNEFNQKERTRQIAEALPGVTSDLEAQAGRARSYASGALPDELMDRAYDMGARSDAADKMSAGGFGATSSVARKASDLMSASQRLQLSQYGDQLLTNNISAKASLLLAPTEYSDAGNQIKVMPSISGSQLAASNLSDIGQQTLISAQNAFTGTVQQNQFATNLEQGTRQFNAANQLQLSEYNAGTANQFKLTKFQYQAGYAASVAGAYQTNSNTEVALAQQAQASQIYQDYLNKAQNAQQAGSFAQLSTALPGIIQSIGSAIKGFSSSPNADDTFGNSPQDQTASDQLDTQFTPPTEFGASPSDQNSPGYISPGYNVYPEGTSDTSGLTPLPDYSSESGGGGYGGGAGGGDYSSGTVQSFQADTGYAKSLTNDPQAPLTKSLIESGNAVVNTAGLSYTPQPGYVSAGFNSNGRQVYTNLSLAQSDAPQAGSLLVNTIKDSLNPMGVLTNEDANKFDRIGIALNDTAMIASLTDAAQRGDSKQFVNQVVNTFGPSLARNLAPNTPGARNNINTAFGAYNLFMNWNHMSSTQRALGLASLGINNFRTASGQRLANVSIIKGDATTPGLNVGQVLTLLHAGVNAYSVIKNWDQMNNVQRIAAGTGTAADLVNTGKMFGLIGNGQTGAAISSEALAQTNSMIANGTAQSVPHLGIGAISVPQGTALPEGYSAVSSQGGNTIAAPTSNLGSAVGAVSLVAGAASVGLGVQQVYKGWGTGGVKGRQIGLLGGSAIAGGLFAMGSSSLLSGTMAAAAFTGPAAPFVLGGVMAASLIATSVKVGKSTAQGERDMVRSAFKKTGLTGDDYKIALADGTQADIGIDGHGGQHQFRDSSKVVEGDDKSKTLNAWDVDYTNDLDYTAGTAGVALGRLLTGGKATNIDQVGGQLGNAALGSVGFGKDYTPENFNKVMTNMRGIYAKAGITSKADAYQLCNQALAEGRINESDAVSMQQTFSMMYDKNGYDMARTLMKGRFQGLKTAATSAESAGAEAAKVPEALKEPITKPARGSNVTPISDATGGPITTLPYKVPKGENVNNVLQAVAGKGVSLPKPASLLRYTKDEIRAKNRAMYQREAA